MDDLIEILTSTATRLFDQEGGDAAARLARQGTLPAKLWGAVEEAGLPLALLSEEAGGFGLQPADALNLIRIGGRFASPVPLGETMLANWLLEKAGAASVSGIATFARLDAGSIVTRVGESWSAQGKAYGVPWSRHAGTIVLIGDRHLIALRPDQVSVFPDAGGSGLPRDDLSFDVSLSGEQVRELGEDLGPQIEAAGAFMRAIEMAGALHTILEITVQYANERIQFGKPIAKLQAIQQQLAVLAGQVAAASAAVDLAAQSWGTADAIVAVAVAKARTGEAAGIVAGIAHQVLGAIGFTEEHRLHLFTKSLWDWRDEYGGEGKWQRLLGLRALAESEDFWPFITAYGAAGESA